MLTCSRCTVRPDRARLPAGAAPSGPRTRPRTPAAPGGIPPALPRPVRPAGSGVVRAVSARPFRGLPPARPVVAPAAYTRRLRTVQPAAPRRGGEAHPVAGQHPHPAGCRRRGVQVDPRGSGSLPGQVPDCGRAARGPGPCEELGDLQERRLVGRDDVDVAGPGPGQMPRHVVFHALADGCCPAGVTGRVGASPRRRRAGAGPRRAVSGRRHFDVTGSGNWHPSTAGLGQGRGQAAAIERTTPTRVVCESKGGIMQETEFPWENEGFGASHRGRPGAVLADGTEPKPAIFDLGSGTHFHETSDWWVYDGDTPRAPHATALRAACSCGWRGTALHPVDWQQVTAEARTTKTPRARTTTGRSTSPTSSTGPSPFPTTPPLCPTSCVSAWTSWPSTRLWPLSGSSPSWSPRSPRPAQSPHASPGPTTRPGTPSPPPSESPTPKPAPGCTATHAPTQRTSSSWAACEVCRTWCRARVGVSGRG